MILEMRVRVNGKRMRIRSSDFVQRADAFENSNGSLLCPNCRCCS